MIRFSTSPLHGTLSAIAWVVVCATAFVTQSCNESESITASPTVATATGATTSSSIKIVPLDLEPYGFQGFVYNSSATQTIPNAVITFSKTDENYVRVVTTDAYGYYKISLKAGNYYSSVTATGYATNVPSPGFAIVSGTQGFETFNFFLTASASLSGYQGFVYNSANFNIKIAGTLITFTKGDNAAMVISTYSDQYGYYKIALPETGGYYVKASVSGYGDYDSHPGLFVVPGSGFYTGNFFLTAQ